MNKKELIKRISDIASLDPKTARLALESILDIITETLADGEVIRIRGFGRMQRRKLLSRKYYHFATKEMRISRAKPIVAFKPSSRLISQRKQIADSGIHIKTISELGFVPQSNSVFNNSRNGGETSEREVEQRFTTKPSKIEHLVSSEGNLIIPNKLNLGTRRQLKQEKEEQIFKYVGTVMVTPYSYEELKYEHKSFPSLLIPRPGTNILNYNHCGYITGGVTEPILYHGLDKTIKAIEPELEILKNVSLPVKNRNYGYKPDIALVWKKYNLYIDVEIDEPYDIVSRRPIHYIGGSDALRNAYFLQNGWFVLRISEEQVATDVDNVVNYVCNLIFCITRDERFNLDFTKIYSDRWTEESAKQMANDGVRERYLGISRIESDEIQQPTHKFDMEEYSAPDNFVFSRPDIDIIDFNKAKKTEIFRVLNTYDYIVIKRIYDSYEFISDKDNIEEAIEQYHYGLRIRDLVEGQFFFIAYENIDSCRGLKSLFKVLDEDSDRQLIPRAIFNCNPISFLYKSPDAWMYSQKKLLYPSYWFEDDFEKFKEEMTDKELLGEALLFTLKNDDTYETTNHFSGYCVKSRGLRTYNIFRIKDLKIYDCFKPAFTFGINVVWAVLNKGHGLTAEIMIGNFSNVKKETLLYLGNLCNAYVMQDKIDLAMQIYLSYDKDTFVPELLNSWRDACMGDIDHFISNGIHKSEFEKVKRMLQDNGW